MDPMGLGSMFCVATKVTLGFLNYTCPKNPDLSIRIGRKIPSAGHIMGILATPPKATPP